MKEQAISLLRQAEMNIQCQGNQPSSSNNLSNPSSDNEAFDLNFKSDESEDTVSLYLRSQSRELLSLKNFPTIEKLFLKHNTPLPSSAAVERVFSRAAIVMGKRRTKLLDSNFEKHLLLNMNKLFWFQ